MANGEKKENRNREKKDTHFTKQLYYFVLYFLLHLRP